MAHRELLTGLPNRRLLKQRAPRIFSRTDGWDRCAGVVFWDSDGYQAVNDEWGHETGDDILVSIAKRMERTTR